MSSPASGFGELASKVMIIPEVVITVCCTVAGSVAIAYTTFHLQAKHRKRTLFSALCSEIKQNKVKLNSFGAQDQSYYIKQSEYIPELPTLYTEAYQNLRLAGELLSLPQSIRQRLEDTYGLISMHNLRTAEARADYMTAVLHDNNFKDRINKMVENLKFLEDELPKKVRCLRPEKG